MRIHVETTPPRRPLLNACLGLALLTALVPPPVEAQEASKNVYVVTHVDLATNGERLAAATKLLREFAAESRHDPGNIQRL